MPLIKVKDKKGKLVKKDGKQKYRVKVNYTDPSGKYKSIERTIYGVEEAKQLERELLYEVSKNGATKKLTLNLLYEQYISAKKHEIKEITLNKNTQIITTHILPYLGDIRLDRLVAPTLQAWKQDIEKLGLSIATRKGIYGTLRAMLNFAVKMDYLQQNPLLKVGNFKAPLERHKEMLFYTPEEFKKYIAAAKTTAEQTDYWEYYVFFCIAYFTGCRKSEIYALTWNDVKDGSLHITKSLNQKLKGGDRTTPPKNKSSIRTIQIPMPLQSVLDEHYKRCQSMPNFNHDYYICGGIKALRDHAIDAANRNFATMAGVKRIRIHDFRHSHASLLANNGINIQEIARRLGHADISITLKTYSHLYPQESERALTVLNQISL